MSVKIVARKQLADQINAAAGGAVRDLAAPSGGWISSMRKVLGMTGAQLGRRMGLSRKRISQVEKAETGGGVTLRSMQEIAAAMDANFVYAIVPKKGDIDDIIERQARRKAEAIVERASIHMALEKQALSEEKVSEQIEQLTQEYLRAPPKDFWEIE